VQRVLKRYGQEAGIENLTPHVIRHSFAWNLAYKGIAVEKIARLLGHANLNTTWLYVKSGFRDWDGMGEDLV
jgi:site-specific recombinase XerD